MRLPGDLNLMGGELQNASAHQYTALPSFNPITDSGRVIYVNTGSDIGFWFGNSDGSGTWNKISLGSTEDSWAVVDEAIANGATANLSPISSSTVPSAKGFLCSVVVATTAMSGYFRVQIFNDVGRTERIYDAQFDAASSLLTDRIPTYFDLDNDAGTIYIDVTNNTGGLANFSVSLVGAGVQLVPLAAPPGSGSGIHAGVAGDGISYDSANARLDVELSANPGLELVGAAGARTLRVQTVAGGGLQRAATGMELDTTVLRTTGAQQAAGIKGFEQLRFVPAVGAGPPAAGAHVAGEFCMDVNQDLWMCTSAGSPGTWVFWGWKEQVFGGATDGTSYTGTCAASSSVDLTLTMTGRRGVVRKLTVWAFDSVFAAADIDSPFRVECYPNELLEGREMLWSVSAQARTSFFSAPTPAPAAVLPINTVGNVSLDDLVRLRNVVVEEEYGRVIARTPGGPSITIDEVTVYDYLANHHVSYATEVLELYWRNNSAVPANYYKMYLRFYNDDPAQALNFGYHLHCENIGGGLPV